MMIDEKTVSSDVELRDATGENKTCLCRNLDFSCPCCYSSKWDTASLNCTPVLFFCGGTEKVRIVVLEMCISLPSHALDQSILCCFSNWTSVSIC